MGYLYNRVIQGVTARHPAERDRASHSRRVKLKTLGGDFFPTVRAGLRGGPSAGGFIAMYDATTFRSSGFLLRSRA